MRTNLFIAAALIALSSSLSAASLSQTFEAGENTSDWGSGWNNGTVIPTFLDFSLGGLSAGTGTSTSQSFWRSFRNNTVGLDVESPYTISMYIQVDAFDGPSGGLFEIMDGQYGASGAHLRIDTRIVDPGAEIPEYEFFWQAASLEAEGGWVDLGIKLELGTPFLIEFAIDPNSLQPEYSAYVAQVTTDGTIVYSATASNLSFASSVITNGQNGELRFYVQASAGGTEAAVDNINIVGIPEPSTFAMIGTASLALLLLRRKRMPGWYLGDCEKIGDLNWKPDARKVRFPERSRF